jgi:hypothetical protein
VKPLQKAILLLDTYQENAARFEPSKISCY